MWLCSQVVQLCTCALRASGLGLKYPVCRGPTFGGDFVVPLPAVPAQVVHADVVLQGVGWQYTSLYEIEGENLAGMSDGKASCQVLGSHSVPSCTKSPKHAPWSCSRCCRPRARSSVAHSS